MDILRSFIQFHSHLIRLLILWVVIHVVQGVALPTSHASVSAEELKKAAPASSDELVRLIDGIRPLLSVLIGNEQQFDLTAEAAFPIEGKPQKVSLHLVRFDNDSFDFDASHPEFSFELRRRAEVTALISTKHSVVFLGRGSVAAADSLAPLMLSERLTTSGSEFSLLKPVVNILSAGDMKTMLMAFLPAQKLLYEKDSDQWIAEKVKVALSLPKDGTLQIETGDVNVTIRTALSTSSPRSVESFDGMKVTEIDRNELERTLLRGVRRASEILRPSEMLTKPNQTPRTVKNGRLTWVDGQRVALLQGTPEEIGTAHGQLLPEESRRCMESVLYAFGAVNSIRTGRWFRHDLEEAYARLAPHIPERHKVETRALAKSLNMEPELLEVLNVFPELFHCSGFAVFGSATEDGKLYHGRVLDYMTTIGLQDAATTFIVRAEGQIPFANIGYAGFIGSVSGMNAEAISLGEMGGRGEGLWDGAPMATLMRRALEECRTLAEVRTLWTTSPRTCHYYYVFADGKTGQAVGVSATPDTIEFVEPGQAHEQLGEGIPDTVVLSAGSRLEELRRRVKEKHGKIDVDAAMALMSRPVAMQSNLHNVLFVPADGVFYVANATHRKPAADTPYARINLREFLKNSALFNESTASRP
jgi:hypothetical protein